MKFKSDGHWGWRIRQRKGWPKLLKATVKSSIQIWLLPCTCGCCKSIINTTELEENQRWTVLRGRRQNPMTAIRWQGWQEEGQHCPLPFCASEVLRGGWRSGCRTLCVYLWKYSSSFTVAEVEIASDYSHISQPWQRTLPFNISLHKLRIKRYQKYVGISVCLQVSTTTDIIILP